MRPTRVVASAALIAALATVAVTGSVGSWTPSPAPTIDPEAFRAVQLESLTGTAVMTTPTIQPASANGSAQGLAPGSTMLEPAWTLPSGPLPPASVPGARVRVIAINPWHHDLVDSWYGPGFYGHTTACGQVLTDSTIGVAHRTLPCGTMVTFRNPQNGETITVPVIDRGPYVAGRTWDLTKGTCMAIGHCWTGALEWRIP